MWGGWKCVYMADFFHATSQEAAVGSHVPNHLLTRSDFVRQRPTMGRELISAFDHADADADADDDAATDIRVAAEDAHVWGSLRPSRDRAGGRSSWFCRSSLA